MNGLDPVAAAAFFAALGGVLVALVNTFGSVITERIKGTQANRVKNLEKVTADTAQRAEQVSQQALAADTLYKNMSERLQRVTNLAQQLETDNKDLALDRDKWRRERLDAEGRYELALERLNDRIRQSDERHADQVAQLEHRLGDCMGRLDRWERVPHRATDEPDQDWRPVRAEQHGEPQAFVPPPEDGQPPDHPALQYSEPDSEPPPAPPHTPFTFRERPWVMPDEKRPEDQQ